MERSERGQKQPNRFDKSAQSKERLEHHSKDRQNPKGGHIKHESKRYSQAFDSECQSRRRSKASSKETKGKREGGSKEQAQGSLQKKFDSLMKVTYQTQLDKVDQQIDNVNRRHVTYKKHQISSKVSNISLNQQIAKREANVASKVNKQVKFQIN